MHAFDVLGNPVRRRILELLAGGKRDFGAMCAVVRQEFSISQPAVSQHLKALRDGGLVSAQRRGNRWTYEIEPAPLREIEVWLEHFRPPVARQ
jgi:DNA-binding transcriptional ArsR family regulator